jgi:hypothetical protein
MDCVPGVPVEQVQQLVVQAVLPVEYSESKFKILGEHLPQLSRLQIHPIIHRLFPG